VIARRLWRDRRGAALIEYALLIGLITLTVLGAVIATGQLGTRYVGQFPLRPGPLIT
jgi:Flp pilus assembly pilin Flp